MGYIPEFKYDIFISYARIDDQEDFAGGLKWISTFQEYFTIALRKRLAGTSDLKIFFDRSTLNSNDQLQELEDAAANSALFLAVCSRAYVEREWTMREMSAFGRQADISKRVFPIDIMPLDDPAAYPDLLADRNREPFFIQTPNARGTTMPLPPDDPRFGHAVHDLAEQVRNQLFAMRAVRVIKSAAQSIQSDPVPVAQDKSGASVVLGQSTDDLYNEREQLRRYLEQFGHDVRPSQEFRQDPEGFQQDVDTALKGADLFVQILGPFQGRPVPGLPGGYIPAQLAAAQTAGVPVMQWRSAAIQLDGITDPDHVERLTGANVVVSGFETFKADVSARLDAIAEERAAPAPAEAAAQDKALPVIFINADQSDLEYAKKVRDEFSRNGFYAAIPLEHGDERDLQSYLRENLLDCDGLVMLYGNTSPVWASRNLRHFNKLRTSRSVPPKLIAVVVGPPVDKADDIGVSMPGLRILGSSEEWQPEAINELIEALSS